MADYCAGKATDLVTRNWLGDPSWTLRYRTGRPRPGATNSLYPSVHSLRVNRAFAEQLDRWARATSALLVSVGRPAIVGFGEVGAMACHRPTAAHNRARGLDLCTLLLDRNGRIDANEFPAAGRKQQTHYLAVSATLRRYFGTVLTAWYNAAHRDHWHIDDLTAVGPIADKRTDTTLVQQAVNLLDGGRLRIDGEWGADTQAGYEGLLDRFGIACTDPKRNTADALVFLELIARTGFAERQAGHFSEDLCAPSCGELIDNALGCETLGL